MTVRDILTVTAPNTPVRVRIANGGRHELVTGARRTDELLRSMGADADAYVTSVMALFHARELYIEAVIW